MTGRGTLYGNPDIAMTMGRTMARTLNAGQERDIAERRARVLAYFAERPAATYRRAGADLGIPKSTVVDDHRAALAVYTDRAVAAYVAIMVARNETLVGAFMPMALRRGSVAHAQVVLAADKRTAELLGLNAPKKVESTMDINVRRVAEEVAAEFGRPVSDVLAEADAILAEARR